MIYEFKNDLLYLCKSVRHFFRALICKDYYTESHGLGMCGKYGTDIFKARFCDVISDGVQSGKERMMIVITSMTELPHSCMACPFQKNQKTPFCRAARNYKRGWSNIPAAFGFYIKDDAFADGQTPWNSRAKWCPLKEVKGADDEA